MTFPTPPNLKFLSSSGPNEVLFILRMSYRGIGENDLTAGIGQLVIYCEQVRSTRVLARLFYDLQDPIGDLPTIIEAIQPVFAYTHTLELCLTASGSILQEVTDSFRRLLRDTTSLLLQHGVSVHITIEQKGWCRTAESLFQEKFCQVVCDTLSTCIKELRFRDDGLFTKDGKLEFKDNEMPKLHELRAFLLKLPSKYPSIQKATGKFPIFANINGQVVGHNQMGYKLYHHTIVEFENSTRITDKREDTPGGGQGDRTLKGECTPFEEQVVDVQTVSS